MERLAILNAIDNSKTAYQECYDEYLKMKIFRDLLPSGIDKVDATSDVILALNKAQIHQEYQGILADLLKIR